MRARTFANDTGDAGNRDGGSNADNDGAAAETEYEFDGFRVMSNEKIMLMPATPALAASGAARRGS